MTRPHTIIEIKDGANIQPAALSNLFRGLRDGRYKIEPKRANKRSLRQNAYYWAGVVEPIRERMLDYGNDMTADDVHEFLKDRFHSKPVIGDGGEMIGRVAMSTTEMNKDEFGEYIDRIKPWAFEDLGLIIQDPNTQMEVFND